MAEQTESGIALFEKNQFLQELRDANALSAQFGLTLSERAMTALAEARSAALREYGRFEFGASAVRALIEGFCDSPYLLQEDYETTLMELTDAFYYLKNACGEQLTDDELILAMRERYDAYDGSVDAVIGTSLESLCRARRFGLEEEEPWEEEDDDDE